MTPQELKNSILQLAIQGKLVEQRPEEGTAQELYREIQVEKQRLIKAGKIKKEKPLSEITEEEKPFEIPESWMWVRLKWGASVLYGYPFDSSLFNEIAEGKPLTRIRDIIPAQTKTYTTETAPDTYIIQNGDMLVGMDGNFNVNFWNGGPAYLNQRVCRILTNESLLLQKYLFYYLLIALDNIAKSVSYVTVKHLSDKHLSALIVPFPPLAEQKRIVAKIEELLPYIDRYEQAWSRLETFNQRFPDDMRKSILQLAIQGKLVEQRPEEGTGDELYREIQAEKQRLIKAGKIKKEKPLPEITEEEKPFEVPESWMWVRLNEVAESSLGKTLNKTTDTGDLCPYLCSINVYWTGITLDTVKEALFTDSDKAKYRLEKGDLLVCEGGDAGRCAIWNEDRVMYYQNALHRIRFYGGISGAYFHSIFELYKSNGIIKQHCKGETIKHLVQSELYSIPFPLPPLAEQKRIVARLEEVLAVCERLK